MDSQLTQQSPTQVAFVFNNVTNYQELVVAFRPGVEVHILDASQDGLVQMAAILEGRSGIEALHVIGHGAQGSLDLGSLTLDSANIGAYGAVLGQIGSTLAPGGDILLYGCDVGANAAGAQFVGQIAQATGADVAASTDATGGAQLGGDWTLEYRTGSVTADHALDTAAVRNFDTLLATNEDVNPGMTTGPGHFVPGFTLTTAQTVYDDPSNGVNGGIYFDTLTESETFTISADGTSVGQFDLAGMTWVKAFAFGEFTLTITGHRADGSTPVAVIYTAQNASNFSVTDDFSDMTGLVSFDVTITGTATDSGAGSTPADLTLDAFTVNNVLPPNKVPAFTDTTTPLNTTENTAVSVLPLLHVNDTDSGQTETWTQTIAPAHGTLSISGATASSGTSNITPGGTITYTPTSGYAGTDTFTVQVSDGAGGTATRTVMVNVKPVAPSAPDLTSATDTGSSSTDNITKATAVSFSGTASVPDGSAAMVFIDKNNNGVYDAGTDISGTATVTSGSWTVNNLDASGLTNGSYNVYGQVTSSGVAGALSTAGSFTIDRTAPTLAISSDQSTLKAGDHATITFTFSEDPGATFAWNGTSGDVVVTGGTLSAISGTGTTRTATFTPTANTDNGSASISVAAGLYSDAAGNNNTAAASTNIGFDTKAPTVSVGSNNSSLHIGQTATISFFFGEAPGSTFTNSSVTVTGGTLSTVTESDPLTYRAVFTPDANTNGGTATITVNAGGYTDAAGNAGTGGSTPPILFDTKAPTVAITSDKAAMGPGDTATITFTFSEDPGASFNWDGTTGDLVVNGGTLSAISGSGTVRTAILTAGGGSTASVTLTANSYSDAAGNTGAGATSPIISLDTTPPDAPTELKLATGSDTGTLNDNKTNLHTPTLSGKAEVGSTVKLYEGATELGHTTAGADGTWSIPVTASLAEGDHTVKAAATDGAGNVGPDSATYTFTVDATGPTVSISSDKATLKAGDTATITFTFSEALDASFSWNDVNQNGSFAVSGGKLGPLSGTGSIRTATFTPDANSDGIAAITVATTSYHDVAGNAGDNASSLNIDVHTVVPTLTIMSDAAATMKAGETATVTFVFTADPDTSFTWDGTAGDLTVSGGTLSALTGTGLIRTAVFTPAPDTNAGAATISVSGGYSDTNGNAGAKPADYTIAFDTLAPGAPSALVLETDTGASGTDGVTKSNTPTLGGTAEAGAIVTLYEGSTQVGQGTADAGGHWSIPTSLLADGAHSIVAKAEDSAHNVSNASAPIDVRVDTAAPTLTITSDRSALLAGEHATITFTFSEDPGSTFTSSSVDVSGGALGAISGSGLTRTAVFTPSADINAGTASIAVLSGKYTDAAGNDGSAATTPSIHFDTLVPTVTITSDKSSLKIGETAVITFTFSEDPGTSFGWDGTVGSVSVLGGTLSATSGTGVTRTAIFTPSANTDGGTASITVNDHGYTDAAGNGGHAGTTPSLVFDTLAPNASVPGLSTDSGSSNTDGLTNATSLIFKGTAEAGATVTLINDATNAVLGTGVAAGGNWSIQVDNLPEGAIQVAAFATDAAGNIGPQSTATAVTIDRTPPGTPSLALGSSNSGTVNVQGLDAGASWQYSLDGGAHWQNGSGSTFQVHADGSYSALAHEIDAAGNIGTASAPLAFTIDTTGPSATVALSDTSLTTGETAKVTFTFSEPAMGFDLADITASNGTMSGLASSDGGRTWTATFTPALGVTADTNKITVNNAGVFDTAGNAGTGTSSSANYSVLTAGVGATITMSDTDLLAGETAQVSIVFTDAVTGFALSDLSAASGKLSDLHSSDGSHWTALFTPSSSTSDTTNVITLDNSGVIGSHGTRGSGTSSSDNYVVNTIRPTASVAIADHLLAPGATTTVSIKFSEAVSGFDASDLSVSHGTLTGLASTDGGRTWTASLTGDSGGKSATPGSVSLHMGGVHNGAGNTGSGNASAQFVVTSANSKSAAVDGAPVITDTVTDPGTGHQDQLIAIPEVKANRVDDSATPNHTLADIPLVPSATPGSAPPVLTASLPTGAGMLVQESAAPMSTSDGLADLIQRINSKTDAGSSTQADMASHGQDFIASLGAGTTIATSTITPTVAPGTSLSQPIVISGANPGQSGPGAPVVGLVIDGSGLPAGTTLQLDNVDFAAVTGDVRLFGGLGRNMVVGDAGSQTIYLGPDDDVLFGGAGNDNVGSAGGNDILDGGDGNDLVAGGIGNDTLYGGNGDDMVQGGRSTVGDWSFFLSGSGAISARHGQAVFTLSGTETVQGSELDATLPELGFLKADPQKVQGIALLYAALDRAPDVAGLSYWAASGASLADVAKGVLASAEFGGGVLGHTDDATFVRGMYEHVLGREPAAADLSYWTGRLSGSDGHPAAARADVLVQVALSDEHKAHVTSADGLTIAQASLKQETGWFAGSGDDRLVGGAGNDLLVGGDGNDTVVYDGKQAQYHFTIGRDNALHVVDTANGDVDTIVAVESAEFKDGTADISFLKADPAQLDRVGLLYQAVLDRAADVGGLKWFLSSGLDAAHLASAVVGSSEFQSHYGGMTDAAFVQALYANSALDTKAAGGEQSWEAYLASHTRAELVAAWITQDDVVHAQFGSSGLWIV